jgi:hypothetical protein
MLGNLPIRSVSFGNIKEAFWQKKRMDIAGIQPLLAAYHLL